MKAISVLCCLVLLSLSIDGTPAQERIESRAERTGYKETSRYQDVMEFITALQQVSTNVKTESFATTGEGRALPLVILSNPAILSPREAASSGKPVVFIMANIHAGEVEGKEAAQHLMRDVATGALKPLLDKVVLLVAPIYNADGNEKIDINNRTHQHGPVGVGTRENAQKLDLNRDFMKLDSPEARGLVEGVLNRWDPHVIIDLHTTNGSYHGYALTYAPSLNPNTDVRITSYLRDKLLPSVTRQLHTNHKYRTYYYGNFADEKDPRKEFYTDQPKEPKVWTTFDHRPRFGNNYIGLRNRIAILSEAYSYLDFRTRVDVTDKFVRAVLQQIAAKPTEVINLTREADSFAKQKGTTFGNEQGFGVAFDLKKTPAPVAILVGSVTREIDPQTNKPMLKATNEARPVKMTEYGAFQTTRRIKPPAAYCIPRDQSEIIKMLERHGIVVEEIKQDATVEVERYLVRETARAERSFQGHREVKLSATPEKTRQELKKGSLIVSMNQPKAALIFYLLEPESDDGLANWNFFDKLLEGASPKGQQVHFPVLRVLDSTSLPPTLLKN